MTASIPFAKTDRSCMCGIVCLHSASWENKWLGAAQKTVGGNTTVRMYELCMHMTVHVCTLTVYIHIYIYSYLYMVIDLQVLVRSFNCESRACCVASPRESVFSEFAKVTFFFAKVLRKWDVTIIM